MRSTPGPFEGPGPSNMLGGQFTGRSFPEWGDLQGNHGDLVMLRMEAATGSLPNAPFLLRKSVEAYLGVPIDGAFPEAKGTAYVLKLRNERLVQRLKKMNQLTDGTAIRIIEHPVLNKTKCVISCKDTVGYTDEELKTELQDQGVVDLRRITRSEGKERVNTPTIILTINGTVAPNHIEVGWLRCPTRPYYPAPMLCFGCYNFGHTKARCQQQNPVCGNCSENHQSDRENPCKANAFCRRCESSEHSLSSRKCPKYKVEEEIQHLRVDLGISYPAAKRTFEQQRGTTSYASIAKGEQEKKFDELAAKVDQLQQDMTNKDRKIEALMQQIEARDLEIKKRDTKIEQLEAVLREGPQERLLMVQEHGTIADLLCKVKTLEQNLEKKSREVITLRKIYAPESINRTPLVSGTTSKTETTQLTTEKSGHKETSENIKLGKTSKSVSQRKEHTTPSNTKKNPVTQDSPKSKRQKSNATPNPSDEENDDTTQMIVPDIIEVDYEISSNDETMIDDSLAFPQ